MCGISGIFNFSKKPINANAIIKKVVDHQKKRGPDFNSIWESKDKLICFGHNRLSIIDLSVNANQPFISNDKNYVITFNGEIYNYLEIKKKLLEQKIKFKSNSDTEVIIESYKFWGIDFLNKLRGMFSFALYDIEQEKLILARDPFGIKPLYYSIKNGVFYFASEAKSLLFAPSISNEFSNVGLVSYYLWGNMQEPHTLYKDIKSLSKGTYKIIDCYGNHKTINYANIKDEIINLDNLKINNENEADEYLKEIISETTKYHLIADVPTSFMLSSGIDSSVLVASADNKNNCSAITLDFENNNKNLNESVLAKKTSIINSIPHKIELIKEIEIKNLIEIFFKKMDLPTNDGLNNFIFSHKANLNNIKVILSGVGGDEFFFGYPSFKRLPKIKSIVSKLPNNKWLDLKFRNYFYKFLKKNKLNTKLSGLYGYGSSIDTAFLLQRALFLPHELNDFLASEQIKLGLDELDIFENLKSDVDGINDEKLKIMYLEIKYYLCSKLLKDCDWTSMSNSVEMRLPFIDWFFFKKLIPLLKTNITINKSKLAKIFASNLPNEIFKRKKTGFGLPYQSYLKLFGQNQLNYSHQIKDWSVFSVNNYLKNQ